MSTFPKSCPHCDVGTGPFVNSYLCGTYLRAGYNERKHQSKRCMAREIESQQERIRQLIAERDHANDTANAVLKEASTLRARVKELEGELKVYRAPIEWAGEDVKRRVAYLNSLRSVVSRRCPVNKMGAPLVTDFDLLAAGVEEVVEGFELARKGVERL